MIRNIIICLVAIGVLHQTGEAQIMLSGQAAVQFLKSAPSRSPRSVNDGRPSFDWEADLFLDAQISDNVAVLSTVRGTEIEGINIDYAAIRLMDLTPLHINVQAGRFDLPFGNLGERRFPRRNFLYGLPLLYEYQTALPDQVTTGAALLAGRGKGGGMRLLNRGIYDLGAMIFGSWGIMDYAVAVSSGTISETTYGTLNANSELGTVARLAVTPFTGMTIGAAYARGAYLEEPEPPAARNIDVNRYHQQAVEGDIEFSRGHAVVYGEAVYNSWPVPLDAGDVKLNVFGYYIEGKYTIMPRLFAALRVSGLRFGNALLDQQDEQWDYDVAEWEGGLGYFVERDVLLKLVRRETRTYGGTRPKDSLTVLQLTVAY